MFLEEVGEIKPNQKDWIEVKNNYSMSFSQRPPKKVDGRKVKRFQEDLEVLGKLMDHVKPPIRLVIW